MKIFMFVFRFIVEEFRVKAKLYLKQSDNEKAVIIDRIEGADFDLPSVKVVMQISCYC